MEMCDNMSVMMFLPKNRSTVAKGRKINRRVQAGRMFIIVAILLAVVGLQVQYAQHKRLDREVEGLELRISALERQTEERFARLGLKVEFLL